jgi:FkbM family methyltransferase
MLQSDPRIMNSISGKFQYEAVPLDLVDQAKADWRDGSWESLIGLETQLIDPLPERATIALLVAAAHRQLGNEGGAKSWTRQAVDWGARRDLIVKMTVAGVYNSLGRYAAICGDRSRMQSCFEKAVSLPEAPATPATPVDSTSRIVQELCRLGMLKDGADYVQERIVNSSNEGLVPPWMRSRIDILKTNMELLQSELSIAQRRGQLQVEGRDLEAGASSVADANAKWESDLKNRATSQLGQDLWVLEKCFYKRNGYFVEFGATDGVVLNNTYLLEKEFGWEGLCAEPNPRFYKELQRNRRCKVFSDCIGSKTGEKVEFIFADAYGGMAKDAECDQHGSKRGAFRDAGDTSVLTTVSLNDFLTANNAPRTIDYISIDTEGSEFSILQNFPFDRWDVRLLTIEHNFAPQRIKIRNLLESFGYQCQEADFDDWYFRE